MKDHAACFIDSRWCQVPWGLHICEPRLWCKWALASARSHEVGLSNHCWKAGSWNILCSTEAWSPKLHAKAMRIRMKMGHRSSKHFQTSKFSAVVSHHMFPEVFSSISGQFRSISGDVWVFFASQDPERSCMQGCRIPSNGALGGLASQKLGSKMCKAMHCSVSKKGFLQRSKCRDILWCVVNKLFIPRSVPPGFNLHTVGDAERVVALCMRKAPEVWWRCSIWFWLAWPRYA